MWRWADKNLSPLLRMNWRGISIQQQDSSMYVALHADQDIPYRDVVHVLDIANQHKMKIVIATKK